MNERERILELMKKGILSMEEGISLLENLEVKKTSETTTNKEDQSKLQEFEDSSKEIEEDALSADLDEPTYEENSQDFDEVVAQVEKDSQRLNQINNELARLKSTGTDKQDQLNLLKEQYTFEKEDLIQTAKLEIEDLQKEIELISAIDEVDHSDEKRRLNQKLAQNQEELADAQEDKFDSSVDLEALTSLEEDISKINNDIQERQEEKVKVMKSLHSGRMREWSSRAKRDVSKHVDLSKNWRNDVSQYFNQATDSVDNAGRDLNKLLRKVGQSARDTFDSVEWSKASVTVPSISQRTFDHQFEFPVEDIEVIDFKSSNGFTSIVESDDTDKIIVEAEITLYGKMHEKDNLEALETRSDIKLEDGKLVFHIPNKRIKANLTVKLPQKNYRYLVINQLNGKISINGFQGQDLYLKSLNGDFYIRQLTGDMVEIKGTNGNVVLEDSDVKDLLVSTINGDVRLIGNYISSNTSTTSGDVKVTLTGKEIASVAANSVNGNVKIALPRESDLNSQTYTTFGIIKSRLAETEEDPSQSSQTQKTILRQGHGQEIRLEARTTYGNILLKDTDQS